eukprot:3041792-Lingulodinium_polyedra.AAC.1
MARAEAAVPWRSGVGLGSCSHSCGPWAAIASFLQLGSLQLYSGAFTSRSCDCSRRAVPMLLSLRTRLLVRWMRFSRGFVAPPAEWLYLRG